MADKKNNRWYAAGLNFECMRCGRCCSGPDSGYIWVTSKESKLIADFLKETPEQVRQKYLKRVGIRATIIEEPVTRNCIFLRKIAGCKKCAIYPVRPAQCRNWPFWPSNLTTCESWNRAGLKCPGINRGRLYTYEQIERIKNRKKWQQD